MQKVIELLRQLQADSLVLFVKTHNFHWNAKGSDFFQVHSATEEIYEKFASMFDDLAERLVQLGQKPIVTLQEALQHSKVKEESGASFYSKEIFSAIVKDYEYLLENFVQLSKLSEEGGDKTTAMYADDQVASLQKSLWMLKASQS
ncbi:MULTISPECIES: Dps family protein [unclassified Helicobacter]|uniref:Dps family protein n=1 Tax=unclassified Helicobacter TaxID=2593540 RepID=UPI000CF16E86|nr:MULTISPECIES: Dps family protein [unclassified Helicobacter]